MREVASWLETTGVDVVPWDEPRLFQLGENTLEALIRISKSVDAAVFIFAEDDRLWYRSDTLAQPRDNVLIEYGLFVGILGPKRAIIARSGNPKSAADLQGLTWVDVSPQKSSRAQLILKTWAQNLGRAYEDPAVTELLLQRAVLQNQLDATTEQLKFTEAKFADLAMLAQVRGLVDFSTIDLLSDGHWKLLFDRQYFQGTSLCLSRRFHVPEDIQALLATSGLGTIGHSLSFQRNNPEYVSTAITKLLRRFRGYESPDAFRTFLTAFPQNIKTEIDDLGVQRAAELRSGGASAFASMAI